ETISGGEVERAIANGFTPERIIYNGPNPATRLEHAPKYIFADSVEAFAANVAHIQGSVSGIRLRPPRIPSHFGVPPSHIDELIAAVRAGGRNETAVSFQVRQEDYGEYTFRGLVAAVTEVAEHIQRESGARIVAFDVGGGRSPQSFDKSAEDGDLRFMRDYVLQRLPDVRDFFIEPGQELDFSLEAFVAPVLEARRTSEGPEIIIDAGEPDFPYIHQAAHRLYLLRSSHIEKLEGGPGRIIGRSCLEADVVGKNVRLPTDIGTSDAIIIGEVGAYDASAHYAFAQGFISGNTSP
ncbi:MAG: hypothetical protein JO165_12990, partial [Candidatus Eremiobacteraeota bacterium]|nr:hypothetical protein [Candidatus Eremiobacteraeota bacterium]